MCPSDPDDIDAEAAAILESMNTPTTHATFDAVFAMTPKQLGQAAVDGAARDANKALSGSELEFIAKRDFARASDATLQADHRKSCLCGTGLYCYVHDAVVGE